MKPVPGMKWPKVLITRCLKCQVEVSTEMPETETLRKDDPAYQYGVRPLFDLHDHAMLQHLAETGCGGPILQGWELKFTSEQIASVRQQLLAYPEPRQPRPPPTAVPGPGKPRYGPL